MFPKRAMAAILAILMVGGCSSGGSPDDAREYSLAAGSNRMSYVVTQYLDAAGVAAKEDLRLRYVTSATASNTNLMAGLLSGEFDFAIPGAQTALDAVAKGVPIQVVAGIANSTNVLIIRSDVASRLDVAPDASPAEKVAALRGLKIGTGPVGSSPYDRFRTMVRTTAIDPDRDLTMLGVTDSSALAAGLRSGVYDAVWVAIGDSEPLVVDGTATMWLSLPRGDFPELNEKSLVVVATTRMIAEHPDVLRKLRASLTRSIGEIRSDPAAAAMLLKSRWYAQMDQKAFDLGWEQGVRVPPDDIDFTEEDLAHTYTAMGRTSDPAASAEYGKLVWTEARGKG